METGKIQDHLAAAKRHSKKAAELAAGADDEERITLTDLQDELAKHPQISSPEIEAQGPGGIKVRIVVPSGWQLVTLVGLAAIAAVLYFLAQSLS